MKKLTTLLALFSLLSNLVLAQHCQVGTAKDSIISDNLKVIASTSTQVDIYNGKHEMHIRPWIGGEDTKVNKRSAISTFSTIESTDFFPGESISNSFLLPQECKDWDRVFKVKKVEIDDFIERFKQGNMSIEDIPESILYWPVLSNFYFFNNYKIIVIFGLSDFVDVDNDRVYDPLKGDYPDIKGADESMVWVVNDYANSHSTGRSKKLNYVVTTMANVYYSNENPLIKNSVFFTSKYYNNSSYRYFRYLIHSLYLDYNSQDKLHDKFGSIPDKNAVYMFNQFNFDNSGNPLMKMDSSLTVTKLLEYPGRKEGVTALSSIFNPGEVSPAISNPDLIEKLYFRFLNGLWSDGTALTYGGLGHNQNSTDTINYLFDNLQSESSKWTICDDSVYLGDIKVLMNLAPKYILPNEVNTISYVTTFLDNMDYPCESIDSLNNALDDLQTFYDEHYKTPPSGTKNLLLENNYKSYPNPANNIVYIEGKSMKNALIKVYNTMGMEMNANIRYLSDNRVQLDLTGNNPGIYFCQISNKNFGQSVIKIVLGE